MKNEYILLRDSQSRRNARIRLQMPVLSMYRNRVLRLNQRIDELQFFLTGMS